MKKNLILFFVISFVAISGITPVIAQTKTPTKAAEASDEADLKDEAAKAVEELKDKVESKVTELKNTNLRTKAGFITTIANNKLTVEGETGTFNTEVDPDVTTVYRISGTSRTEIKADDLGKGDYVLVTGPEIGDQVTANSINVDEHYFSKSEKIIEVNSDDFYIKVQTLEKDQYTIDIESATKSQIVDIKTLSLDTAGFSKLKEGDNIHFVAKKGQDKKATRFSAVRTIIIPQEYFIK